MPYILIICAGIILIIAGAVLLLKDKQKFSLGIGAVVLGVVLIAAVPVIRITSFFGDDEPQKIEKTKEINWSIHFDPELQDKIDFDLLGTILISFSENCRGFIENSDRIESKTVYIRKIPKETDGKLYRQANFGWYTEIEINLKIKSSPSLIIDDKLLSGHTLYFFLGGGKHPGIITMKNESAIFLGLDKSQFTSGEDTYIPADGYNVIDTLIKE